MNTVTQLLNLFSEGRRAASAREFDRPGGTPLVIAQRPIVSAPFSVRELEILQLVVGKPPGAIQSLPAPQENPAKQTIPLSTAITNLSRVAAAGAQIVVVDPVSDPIPIGATGDIAYVRRTQQYVRVDPAPFVLVPEPVPPALPDLAESDIPISRVAVTFSGPSYGVRFKLTRRYFKDYFQEVLIQQLLASITAGLARATDHALLSAIVAATPGQFSIAAAAASRSRFADLRAMVGTDGAAAAVGQDGQLRAAGVAAELTDTIAPTVIGSFGHAGIALHDSLRVEVERIGAAGDLFVTCWADLEPLLPSGAPLFWQAA